MTELQPQQPVKRNRLKRVLVWLLVIGFLVAGLIVNLGLAGGLIIKKQSQTLLNQLEKPELGVRQVSASENEAVYELIKGWNLVAFTVKPVNFKTASGLIMDVAKKGGYVTVVSSWDGDKWIEFAQRGEDQFGHDFKIEHGKAYFLKNQKAVAWSVVGTPITVADVGEYELQEGWNTIGLLDESDTASTVIDKINVIGATSFEDIKERATVMDWWTQASNWELYIKRIYSPDNIQEYGENFEISKTNGYMIYLSEPVVWRAYE